MQTSYIYSVSRVNTLSQFLLNKTDIERLLVSEPGEALQQALKETYLAPYVAQVSSGSVADAIEKTLIDAKRLVHKISPNGDMFRVLWVQYDIHNLRVFAKAAAKGVDFEGCKQFTSARGIYEPEALYDAAFKSNLNGLQVGWQEAYDEAVRFAEAGEIDKIDGIFDVAYFETSKRVAKKGNDAFISRYLEIAIDLYNLRYSLRTLQYPQIVTEKRFISGGSFSSEAIETKEDVLQRLFTFGSESFWRDAVDYYLETGNTTRIDARADEYMLTIAKEGSFDMFSSASLVLYYLQCRQAAANVRTIVVGKNSGMSEEDIRANLRMAYVND